MNFSNSKTTKIIFAVGFLLPNLISSAIGMSNTPGRPNPIQAPGAFQKPFNSIPTYNPRAEINTETPRELATPEDIKNRRYKPISVIMTTAKGKIATGSILFFQMGNTVEIKGYLSGLKPGKHGMHIHQNGNCSDKAKNFQLAGPHFNPKDVKHGSLKKGHTGDLGNIIADKRGIAQFSIKTDKFTLEEGRLNSIVGRSIMVHLDKDNEKTNPAGKSGARILCGVIR